MKKKILSFVLVVALIFSMVPAILFVAPTEAYASTAHSQAEAVAWAKARANEGWCVDVDNAYGCQCVDLVIAYYDYLGVRRSSGNACDYASNSLPSGWSRVYSNPQPGDVIVWGPGAVLQDGGYKADPNFGHIGIVTGVVSSNQVSTVETNTYNNRPAKAFAARYSSTAACFIRPDFVATPAEASWDGPVAKDITETNAFLSGTVSFNQTVNTTQCGIRLYDSNGKCIAQKDESVNYNTSYVNIWYDLTGEMGVSLTSGKTYTFKLYAISNGRDYWSPTVKFTTAHTHSYSAKVTAPTCTEKGYTTHPCACGDSYKDSYVNALGHNFKNGACTRCGEKDPDYEPTAYPFTDVDVDGKHKPFAGAILWAADEGITTGYGNGIFKPDADCTRAQVVTFLWRAAGEPAPKSTSNPFADVSAKQANGKDNPYYTAILWAVGEGITLGVDKTHFAPDATVTRAQFVTFLWRYEGKPAAKPGVTLTDLGTVTNADFKSAILWAAGEGITTGYGDGSFRPNAVCTRAHVVTFIYRDMAE